MTYLNNQQKFNDVVFANRNKAYGAYAIRSSYGETIFKSLAIMIFSVGSFFTAAFYYTHREEMMIVVDEPEIIDSIYTIPVYFPPEEITVPEMESPKSPVKPSQSGLSTNFSDSTFVETSDTLQTDFTATHTNSIAGEDTSVAIGEGHSGTSTLSVQNPSLTSNTIKGLLEVDSQPEFEGGLKALNKFIASQLRYPERASEAAQQGKVYVRFVVDENGKVSNIELLNSAGFGMDEEAIRVVSLIPKFKSPAKVKGVAVKTYFHLPIRFNYR